MSGSKDEVCPYCGHKALFSPSKGMTCIYCHKGTPKDQMFVIYPDGIIRG